MIKRIAVVFMLASWSVAAPAAKGEAKTAPKLDVSQILEKNLAARGGLEAWRKVQTILWVGHLQSNKSPEPVPFTLRMKRPDKMRFEVEVEHEKSIRAFDGKEGWKVRPPHTGKAELTPFTPEEVRFAHDAPGIDGPLIDHEAKGISVQLDGTEEIEGHKVYRLIVKLPSGTTRHVWIDATTFLEVRYDRETRVLGGQPATVLVNYREYRAIDGLQIPMMIETASANGQPGDRMVIDRVLLNPPIEESEFSWPGGPARRSHAFGPSEGPPPRSAVPPALDRRARPGSSAVSGVEQPGSPAEARGAHAGAAAAPQPQMETAPAASDPPPAAGPAPK